MAFKEKQKDNLVKFLYDVIKILLASVVLVPIGAAGNKNWILIGLGLFVTLLFTVFVIIVDMKEIK